MEQIYTWGKRLLDVFFRVKDQKKKRRIELRESATEAQERDRESLKNTLVNTLRDKGLSLTDDDLSKYMGLDTTTFKDLADELENEGRMWRNGKRINLGRRPDNDKWSSPWQVG